MLQKSSQIWDHLLLTLWMEFSLTHIILVYYDLYLITGMILWAYLHRPFKNEPGSGWNILLFFHLRDIEV